LPRRKRWYLESSSSSLKAARDLSPCTRAERAKGSEPWRSFQREPEEERRMWLGLGLDGIIRGLGFESEVEVRGERGLVAMLGLIRETLTAARLAMGAASRIHGGCIIM
jgi:hypothetical protein